MPDETQTPDLILDAAEKLFAAQGYAATTIKQIGTAAGVNAALLYYYFDDKEQLYYAVLRRVIGTLGARVVERMAATHDPESALRALVAVQAETLSARPHIPQLLMRELIDYGGANASPEFRRLSEGAFHNLCDAIRDGQRQGIFRPDLDPRLAAISTIAQVAYFCIARPVMTTLLNESPDVTASPERVKEFGRHAADFAVAALTCDVGVPHGDRATGRRLAGGARRS
jgi:TetR/AcrR family transcriptional regulator